MHSVGASESHEVMHRRGNEFPSDWDRNVRVCVSNDSVPAGIDDLAVHTRIMSPFLFQDFEGTSFGEMPVTSARNRGGQNDPPILQQVSRLFL